MLISFLNAIDINLMLEIKNSFGKYHLIFHKVFLGTCILWRRSPVYCIVHMSRSTYVSLFILVCITRGTRLECRASTEASQWSLRNHFNQTKKNKQSCVIPKTFKMIPFLAMLFAKHYLPMH